MGKGGYGETYTNSTYKPTTFLVQYLKRGKWKTFGDPYPDYMEALSQLNYSVEQSTVSGSIFFGAKEFRITRQEVITTRKVQEDGEHRPTPRTEEERTHEDGKDKSADGGG